MAQGEKIETRQRIVLIGGSAGSLAVLLVVLPLLPRDLAAPVILVTHRHSGSDVLLESLLSARASLPVRDIEEKEMPQPGVIYIAPADYHLLFEPDGSFALDSSEKVNYSRPSIDVTFESAARAYGARAIGILLSGANADGAQGLYDMQQHGGTTIVQDPATAEVDYMPRCALQLFSPAHIARPADMAQLISSEVSKMQAPN